MHDVLDVRDVVADEWRQLDSSGYDVGDLRSSVLDAVAANDSIRLRTLLVELAQAPRRADWPYVEPSQPEEILAALDEPLRGEAWGGTEPELEDRLRGAWLARCVGCVMGKPVEGLDRERIERYLRAADAWPQRGYIPLLEPLPEGIERLHSSAPRSAAGRFDAVPRDDDTDYTVLGLHLLETYGRELSVEHIALEWLDRLPFTQTFTAERAAYRNLIEGVTPERAAVVRNPYREWIGALIRADAFGYACPGDACASVKLAIQDARLSHVANGIYGEMWAAALVSSAFTATDIRDALLVARSWLPASTRMREAQGLVLELHAQEASWEQLVERLDALVGHYDWVHTVNNAAAIAASLLWGEGDLVQSVGLVVALGWDTDSDGATVGSVLGAMHGSAVVPTALSAPFNNQLRSAIRDYDRCSISELAQRTLVLALDGARRTTDLDA